MLGKQGWQLVQGVDEGAESGSGLKVRLDGRCRRNHDVAPSPEEGWSPHLLRWDKL